jgi:hypothetical protein
MASRKEQKKDIERSSSTSETDGWQRGIAFGIGLAVAIAGLVAGVLLMRGRNAAPKSFRRSGRLTLRYPAAGKNRAANRTRRAARYFSSLLAMRGNGGQR